MKSFINDILAFITDLKNRKGGYIFFAIILSKFLGFMLSVFVIKNITTYDYGLLSYAYNIISFVAPFAGFGIFQSLSRYGPIQRSQLEKRKLFKFVFTRGVLASIVLSGVVILLAKKITHSIPESHHYLTVISLFIISHFIFETIKINYRIYHVNKLFAYLEIGHSCVLLISGVVLTYFYGGFGYLAALILAPLLLSFYIVVRYRLFANINAIDYSKSYKRSLWSYGIYTSLGGLASQLIFSVDIITIGYIVQDATSIALYKAASLIPMALLFIPTGVMKTDLVKIAQNHRNKLFLKQYAQRYIKVFSLVSLITSFVLIVGANFLVGFFGSDYINASPLIVIFVFGLVGAFILRVPFGNIITSVGWAKVNTLISVSTLILDVILNLVLVKKFGIIGAAYSTSILLWVAGILSYFAFIKYLRTLE